MSCSRPLLTLVAAIVTLSLSGPANSVEKPPPGSRPVPQGPILDQESGSYFELRVHKKGDPTRHWEGANRVATGLIYEGRHGRLAVVKDQRTLKFVRDNFRFSQPAWIGMRFYCGFRKLMWVTGELQPLHSPGMWAPSWHRTGVKCTNNKIVYMPVYLTDEGSGTVSWQASGPAKAFNTYLVEYPVPPKEEKPEKKVEKETKEKSQTGTN